MMNLDLICVKSPSDASLLRRDCGKRTNKEFPMDVTVSQISRIEAEPMEQFWPKDIKRLFRSCSDCVWCRFGSCKSGSMAAASSHQFAGSRSAGSRSYEFKLDVDLPRIKEDMDKKFPEAKGSRFHCHSWSCFISGGWKIKHKT